MSIYKFLLLCLALLPGVAQAQFEQGIKADYYNGINFDQFVRSKIEKSIGFSRKLKSPTSGVGKEFFSIRYTGSIIAPKTGLYNFYVLADDGVRVSVNHQRIIDAWYDQEAASYSGSIILEKDERYDIEIEYYNSIVHSVLSVRWEVPMENYQLFDLGHQPIVTAIPTEALKPTRSEFRQRSTLVIGRVAENTPVPPEGKRVIRAAETQDTATEPKQVSRILKRGNLKPKPGVIVENEAIVLSTVVFDQQSSVLKEGAAKELDHLVKYLKTFETRKIEISGYTDYLGDSLDNQILSEQRAKTIASYLKNNGIAESRITAIGYGGMFPLVVSKNVKDRNANRRVEFKIIE